MKYCTNCGGKLNEGTKFCTNCGENISKNNPEKEPQKTNGNISISNQISMLEAAEVKRINEENW